MKDVYTRGDMAALDNYINREVERRGRSGDVAIRVKEEVYGVMSAEGEVTQVDIDTAFVCAVLDAAMDEVSGEVGGPDGYRSLSRER